jgi:uncharacterized membrane protein YhdT
MNDQVNTLGLSFKRRLGLQSPQALLSKSVTSWLLVALIGQWLFAIYVFIVFAFPFVTGGIESVDFSTMITGSVDGDSLGNTILMAHLIPAIVISMGGVLQVIPQVRNNYLRFHRWNGRVFLTLGMVGALTGLYLTWGRGSRLSDIGAYGITLNGILIIVTSFFAWRYALAKRFDVHRRLAVHAFILINGVWTFRLYLMGWFVVNQGPNGNSGTLDGPADIFISYACYMLPMLVAELFFWAQRQREKYRVIGVSGVLFLGTIITAIGVIAASLFMWFPRVM